MFLLVLALIFSLTSESRATVIWDWSFDTEAGQFITTGNLTGTSLAAGTYQLLDFSVSVTALGPNYIGSMSGGQWDYYYSEQALPSYQLIWDGTAVSEWQNSGTTSYPTWHFTNSSGAGIKVYYFGVAVENFWYTGGDPNLNPYVGPTWASLTANEAYPPPPGYHVAEGTITAYPSGSAPIPDASIMLLLGPSLLGLGLFNRKRKRN
jgi:hypothetical protein